MKLTTIIFMTVFSFHAFAEQGIGSTDTQRLQARLNSQESTRTISVTGVTRKIVQGAYQDSVNGTVYDVLGKEIFDQGITQAVEDSKLGEITCDPWQIKGLNPSITLSANSQQSQVTQYFFSLNNFKEARENCELFIKAVHKLGSVTLHLTTVYDENGTSHNVVSRME